MVFVLITTVTPTRADIVLSFSPPDQTVDQGDTATIDVQARALAGTQSLGSYDVFVDLGPPAGAGIPTGWSATLPVVGALAPSLFSPSTSPIQGDLSAAGAFFAGATLTTTPVTLWQFTATTGTQVGFFPVSFLTGSAFSLLDFPAFAPINFTIDGPSAPGNITVVPEPSSLALMTIPALAALAGWRRRRRTSADHAVLQVKD